MSKNKKNNSTNNILNELTFTPSMRYVFFKSLKKYAFNDPDYDKIYDFAIDTLDTIGREFSQNRKKEYTSSKIMAALNFLHDAAEYERAKEIQFFQNLKTRYPNAVEVFNIPLDNPTDNDYINFIANINSALKGTKNFKERLSTEYDRLSRAIRYETSGNKKDLFATKIGKGKWANEELNKANDESLTFFKRGGYSFNRYQPNRDPGRRNFKDIFERSDAMSKITSKVISEYGGQLFLFNKNSLTPNPAKLAALIKVLSDEAYALFVSKYKVINDQTVELNLQDIILGKDFEQFVNSILNSPYLESALTDIAHQYNLNWNPDFKEINPQVINNLKQDLIKSKDRINKEIPTHISENEWLQKIGATDQDLNQLYLSTLSVSAQAYYTGEDLNLIELLSNGIGVSLGGGKNPTDDIYGGKLIINYNLHQDTDTLEQELNNIGRKAYQNIEGLSQQSIVSFRKNTQTLQEARKNQLEQLKLAEKKASKAETEGQLLLQHINIHTTIKGYSRAGGKDFLQEQGFSGASFGSNLIQELNIIQEMANSGGIDLIDLNFLYFAMINAGAQMLGRQLKSNIEDYFSIFVGFLMFNDAELMFEDINNWTKDHTLSNIIDLHLYELNGITFPTSYLLENTWKALTIVTQDINTSQKGTRATLTTYDKGPIEHNWEKTSSQARKDTKLEIHFLAGFLDILQQINDAMPK